MLESADLSVAATVAINANPPTVQTVFVIALENHNFIQPSTITSQQQLFANPAAPYLNSLITPGNAHAAMTSYASSYNNVPPQLAGSPSGAGAVHPSEPNYIWAEAGQTAPNGVRTDGDPSGANNNILPAGIASLSAELQTKFGATGWESYQEDSELNSNGAVQSTYTVPLASVSGNNGPINAYNGSTQFGDAPRHDPQAFFSATSGAGSLSHYAPLQQLQTDLNNNTVAKYNWITPDLFNDMHTSLTGGFSYNGAHFTGDAANVAQGDNFLSIIVPEIEASAAFQNNGAIVIWNDETEGADTSAFTGTEIVISPLAMGNAFNSTLSYDHSSDLKTWSELFGVVAPGDAATPLVNDLSDLFQPGAIAAVPLIESFGATTMVETGNDFFMYADGTANGPELKFGGAPVVAGQIGGWTVIGAEATASGYEVALKLTGSSQYTVWNTDGNGNVISDSIGAVPGTSTALESLEPGFHQDLNGDGVIGIPAIESFGSTSLVEIGNNFFMYANGTTSGPELKLGGTPVVAGQISGWTLIGAEATASGYEVALKLAGSSQYTVWNTDGSGNVTYDSIGSVSGTSTALESLESSFHQDLNGDGVIGIPAIESFGSTSLIEIGNNFFMYANGTTSGPELKLGGTPVVAGQIGGWTLIGAEATASGYEVALKLAGTTQYTVWNTDGGGNVTYDSIGSVSGTSTALESLEPSFHQDLNGDGVIGIPAIESFGSTSLVEIGNNFFMYANGTTVGPELKLGGTPVVAGQIGGWTLIGAEATASGYEVALKLAGSSQYTVWNTDGSGNVTYDSIGSVSGTSTALESLEPGFHQDLNGDGMIGIPSGTSPGPSNTAPQGAMVAVMNKDTFVFGRAAAVSGAADPTGADLIKGDGLFSAAGIQPAEAFHDAQTAQSSPALFDSTRDGHDIASNPDDHVSARVMDFHWIDSHASGFIIH